MCINVHRPLISQGSQLYSCDCFGGVIQWDTRSHSILGGWELGPYAVNALAIDPAGKSGGLNHESAIFTLCYSEPTGALLSCASADCTIRLVDTSSDKVLHASTHTHTKRCCCSSICVGVVFGGA